MSKVNQNRVVIITGANSGIGKAAALKFAANGWQVVMACRSVQKGRKAQAEITQATGNVAVQVMESDTSSFGSIRRFCAAFKAAYSKLDVLIHNAGYFNHGTNTYQYSVDGLELTFATNVFGPLLMTELLLDHLALSSDPRILNAGSTNLLTFFDPKRAIEFDNLRGEFDGKRPYTVYKMYGDSKMALLLLTYRMAKEYKAKGVKVNAVLIPTVKVDKETLTKFSGIYRIVGPLLQYLNPFAMTQQAMADCYHHICTSSEFSAVTGALVDSKHRIIQPSQVERVNPISIIGELLNTRHAPPYASKPDNIERMWTLSREVMESALGEAQASCVANVSSIQLHGESLQAPPVQVAP